jgi:hypothetical protein
MSTVEERIRQQEAARAARRAEAAAGESRQSKAPAVREKPVRKTVDLPPHRYALLTQWCSETAVELGVARVTGQDVFNTLVARLLTDETLARKIRADLAGDFQQR